MGPYGPFVGSAAWVNSPHHHPAKQNLAPVLDSEELRSIILSLGTIPSFVIGGLEPDDVDNVLSFGAYGMAACNALFEDGKPSACGIRRFVDAVSSSSILAA